MNTAARTVTPNAGHTHAADHALPFRVIFQEVLARLGSDSSGNPLQKDQPPTQEYKEFLDLIDRCLPGADSPLNRLWTQIHDSEIAYHQLQSEKAAGKYGAGVEEHCRSLDQPLLHLLHSVPRSALCLSGGGIRSASFSLGVLQALAQFNDTSDAARCQTQSPPSALEDFDYLSTVSGGGYIGSWLMAWTHRLTGSMSPKAAFRLVARQLAGCDAHTSGDPAPRAFRHLREYTSFLAPKLGLSLDSLTLAALVFRNLIVNWAMILPLVLTLVAAFQTVHYGMFWLSHIMAKNHLHFWMWWIFGWFVVSGFVAGWRMPSARMEIKTHWRLGTVFVFSVYILPLLLSSLPLVDLWINLGPFWIAQRWRIVGGMSLAAFVTFVSVPLIRGWLSKAGNETVALEHKPRNYVLAGLAAAIVTSFLLALTLQAIGSQAYQRIDPVSAKLAADDPKSLGSLQLVSPFDPSPKSQAIQRPASKGRDSDTKLADTKTAASDSSAHSSKVGTTVGDSRDTKPGAPNYTRPQIGREESTARLFVILAFPVLWTLLIAASALFSGLLGIFEEDIDREWWARAGALMLGVLIAWIVAETMVVHASGIVADLSRIVKTGIIAGLIGAFGGASTAGGIGAAGAKSADVSKVGKLLNKFNLIVPAFCAVALLMLGLLMTVLENWIAAKLLGAEAMWVHFEIFAGALVLSLLVNWAININLFSLHGMYRMRLMRAFLGASNTRRMPNPFTGFDDNDNVYEKDMPIGPGVPTHLINATVNLVGTRKLAWQQRKAEGFTFSRLQCGGWRLGYVPTAHYGRNGGVSLGTAMAISGAAFNPNMGYHSSPLVTLLMTLFNVRLGWWLPNPKYKRGPIKAKICRWLGFDMHKFMQKKAPRLALRPLLQEALGGTDDLTAYIELTDGGHFENLGLYEMVMRRCRYIVVVDAGADPKCQLEDLGNALRKIEIDLGIPIIFPLGVQMKAGASSHNPYCAMADVHYEYVDQVESALPGKLLYIKAAINGNEPPDVTQYARTHPTFPHESTANQFFNEAQFESYRHLGHHALRTILKQGRDTIDGVKIDVRSLSADEVAETSMKALFTLAASYAAVKH
jgi:hypothetical protein